MRNRPEGTTNDKMISGKIEILAKEIEVLNAAATPPFQIDGENISENVRLTNRAYRPAPSGDAAQPAPALSVAMGVRRYLDAQGFIDIETPMLTRSTPEGARDLPRARPRSSGRVFLRCRNRRNCSNNC